MSEGGEVIEKCYFSVTESCLIPYLALFSCLDFNSLSLPVPSSKRKKSMTSCSVLLPHTCLCALHLSPSCFFLDYGDCKFSTEICKKLYAKSTYRPRKTLLFPALILISNVNILESIFHLLKKIYNGTG